MKNLHVDHRFARLALVLSVLLLAAFYAISFTTDFTALIIENGPIENLQLVTIAAAMAVFLMFTLKAVDAERIVGLGAVFLCAGFLFRELDMRQLYGRESWQALIHDRTIRYTVLVLLAVAAAVYLYRNRRHIPEVMRYGFSREAWPLLLAGGLLVCSKLLFEWIYKHWWHDLHWEFLEQGSQSVAYLLILLTAVRFLQNVYESAPHTANPPIGPEPGTTISKSEFPSRPR